MRQHRWIESMRFRTPVNTTGAYNGRSMQLSRRHFLASASALPLLATTPSIIRTRPWYQKMRRCGEVNFDETDPGRLDIAECVEYWSSLKVDALLVNAGGMAAFYPTKIPGHHRSESLGEGDLFGDFAKAAKERGIRVVARLDCNLAHPEALQLRPEWFVRAADGQPVKHGESPRLYQTCMFTSYFTEQMPAIIREVNSLYDVDGFFTDGWPGTGGPPACRCEACGRLAARNTAAFAEQHMARVLEIWKLWDNAARRKNRIACTRAISEEAFVPPPICIRLAGVANWINAEQQGRTGAMPIWECAQQGRVAQSVMKGRCTSSSTSPAEIHHVDGADHGERYGAVVSAIVRTRDASFSNGTRSTRPTSSTANRWRRSAWCSASA